jgi:hypothetical protein
METQLKRFMPMASQEPFWIGEVERFFSSFLLILGSLSILA